MVLKERVDINLDSRPENKALLQQKQVEITFRPPGQTIKQNILFASDPTEKGNFYIKPPESDSNIGAVPTIIGTNIILEDRREGVALHFNPKDLEILAGGVLAPIKIDQETNEAYVYLGGQEDRNKKPIREVYVRKRAGSQAIVTDFSVKLTHY